MHIGILKTDAVRPEWVDEFGEYPDMFQRLVLAANSDVSFSVWDVEEGVRPTPAEIDAVDGFIITGSKSSAYDDKEWIRDLERLVQELHARRKKMVGICFGHQVIARALGGTVAKSDKGWGVGVNVYNVSELPVQGDDEDIALLFYNAVLGADFQFTHVAIHSLNFPVTSAIAKTSFPSHDQPLLRMPAHSCNFMLSGQRNFQRLGVRRFTTGRSRHFVH